MLDFITFVLGLIICIALIILAFLAGLLLALVVIACVQIIGDAIKSWKDDEVMYSDSDDEDS